MQLDMAMKQQEAASRLQLEREQFALDSELASQKLVFAEREHQQKMQFEREKHALEMSALRDKFIFSMAQGEQKLIQQQEKAEEKGEAPETEPEDD